MRRKLQFGLLLALLVLGLWGLTGVGDINNNNMENIFLKGAVIPHTLNIAHRGARSLAPENTIAAARKAWEIGADAWELDVQLTKDGVPIVMHDYTLERTTNAAEVFPDRRPWRVSDFTLAEIKRLDAGSWFIEQDPFGEIAAGHVSQEELESYRGEPVPTLREALEFTKEHNWRVNIELKAIKGVSALKARKLSEELVDKTIALIRELKMENQVIVSSFDHSMIYKLKQKAPEIAGAVLVATSLKNPLRYLKQVGADAYNPSLSAFQPDVARELRQAGYGVNVWTVNDPETMRQLIAAGVSGIFTDYPQRLEEVLEASSSGAQLAPIAGS